MVVMAAMIVSVTLLTADTAHAEIPNWIKDVSGFWAEGLIDDDAYLGTLTYLVDHGLIKVPTNTIETQCQDMVDQGLIELSDINIVSQCQDMLTYGTIKVPTSIAKAQCQDMINKGTIDVPVSAISRATMINQCQSMVDRGGMIDVPVSAIDHSVMVKQCQTMIKRGLVDAPPAKPCVCSEAQSNPTNKVPSLSERLEVTITTCEETYNGESVWVKGTMKNISNEKIRGFEYRAYVADRSGNPLVFKDGFQGSINPGSTSSFISLVPYDGPWSSCGIEY